MSFPNEATQFKKDHSGNPARQFDRSQSSRVLNIQIFHNGPFAQIENICIRVAYAENVPEIALID